METILQEAKKINLEDRILLVHEIWESIFQDSQNISVPQWQKEELRRRKDKYRENPEAGSSWEEVKQPTRHQAILTLEKKTQQHIEMGELPSLEINSAGVSGLAGKYKEDPTLEEICDEIYQARNSGANP